MSLYMVRVAHLPLFEDDEHTPVSMATVHKNEPRTDARALFIMSYRDCQRCSSVLLTSDLHNLCRANECTVHTLLTNDKVCGGLFL